jgi:hypothetical protein
MLTLQDTTSMNQISYSSTVLAVLILLPAVCQAPGQTVLQRRIRQHSTQRRDSTFSTLPVVDLSTAVRPAG